MFRTIKPQWIMLVVIFALLVHVIAEWKHLYFYYWWLDIPMHFIVSVSLGLIFFSCVSNFSTLRTYLSSQLKATVFVVCSVLIMGVVWEVFEYHFDPHIRYSLLYVNDTLKDLLVDLLGGVSSSLIFLNRRYNSSND
jgi:hypothetical protein